ERNSPYLTGWLYTIDSGRQPIEITHRLSAFPSRCPCCEADYAAKNNPTPLRNHRTGFQKAAQVLAGGLMREMPEAKPNAPSSRKLVIFSDSRQDAAKLAAGMQRDHYRDLIRMALIQVMNAYWNDLEGFLRFQRSRSGDEVLPRLKSINPLLYEQVILP